MGASVVTEASAAVSEVLMESGMHAVKISVEMLIGLMADRKDLQQYSAIIPDCFPYDDNSVQSILVRQMNI